MDTRPVGDQVKRRDTDAAAMVAASPHGLALLGMDGVVRDWNPAAERIFGIASSKIAGQAFWPLLGVQDSAILPLLSQRADTDHEFRHNRADGTVVDIALAVAPFAETDGTQTGYIVVFSDVTRRKLIEEHLRSLQRLEAIARLIGGVAHDFNNLLQVISGRVMLATDALAAGGDARAHLDEIAAAAKLASSHTRQLLTFSQRQELRPHILRIDAVIRRAERMLKRIVGSGVAVVVRGGAGDARVIADQHQIERLLADLALNARAAMPNGGTLTVETDRMLVDAEFIARHPFVSPGDYVVVVVSDTGMGMDDATLRRLFEPFFTTKEMGNGAGLGLATVFGIVKQSGGYIVAESERGVGSTFRILLPPAPADEAGKAARRASGARVKAASASIMLVEDTASVRRLMALALAKEGYDVIEAANASEAIARANERGEALHVLVLDVSLPDGSGLDIARMLAASHPHVGVILISGYGLAELALEDALKERTILLEKPFAIPDLRRAIRDLLERGAPASAHTKRGPSSSPNRAGQK